MTELHRFHGPPGCGKTSAVSVWAAKAVEKFGGPGVVLCSLTRAAAHEIRSRVGAFSDPIPDDQVGTLHALCWRALGRPELHVEKVADWNARHPTLALSGDDDEIDDLADGPRSSGQGDALEQATSLRRARRIPIALWPSPERDFFARWSAWKTELGVVDFTELLELALDHDIAPPGGADVVFYDEAQDGAALDLAIIRRWAEQTAYTVIAGDCDQLLFRFRGADPDVFLAPLPTGPGAEHPLTQSFRVPEAVRAHAQTWISGCTRRFAVDYRARLLPDGSTAQGLLRRADLSLKSDRVVELVEDELEAVRDSRDGGGRVMILATCGYLLAPTLVAMRKNGIPFHCPTRAKAGAWNPMRGARRLASFLQPMVTASDGQRRLWTAPELWAWVEHCRADGLVRRGMKTVLEGAAREARKKRRLAALTVEEINAYLPGEPLRELIGAFRHAIESAKPDAPLAWLRSRIAPRHTRSWEFPQAVVRRGGIRALVEEPRVLVGTCHAYKGGEAESVVLSPDVSPAGARSWGHGADDRDDVVRTFYVGMTRARERLTILQSAVGWPCAIPI